MVSALLLSMSPTPSRLRPICPALSAPARSQGWPISDCTAEGLKAMLVMRGLPALAADKWPAKPSMPDQRFFDAANVILVSEPSCLIPLDVFKTEGFLKLVLPILFS